MKRGSMKRVIAARLAATGVLWTAGAQDARPAQAAGVRPASVSDYNIVWDSPSTNGNGSMPVGNGDIGANVWVEDGGDLLFYVSTWDGSFKLHAPGQTIVRGKVRSGKVVDLVVIPEARKKDVVIHLPESRGERK